MSGLVSARHFTGAHMKVGQKTIVRWMSKLAAKGTSHRQQKQFATGLRELDIEQQRHVSGGVGVASQLPNKGW
jgi:hypothetical protein